MSTSGITVSQLSRDDIINAALRKLLVIGEGQIANTNQITTATQALNTLVAEYRTLGMAMWARKSYDMVLVNGQQDYTFGVGQTINIPYPLKIYTANLLQSPTFDTKIIVNQLSFTDFDLLPQGSLGTPVNFKYQPKVNVGVVSVWPIPQIPGSVLAGTIIRLTYQSPFEYFVAATDTPDFPEHWGNALIYGLADSLADEMGVSLQIRQLISGKAAQHLATALSGDTEEASLFFQRDWAGYPW